MDTEDSGYEARKGGLQWHLRVDKTCRILWERPD